MNVDISSISNSSEKKSENHVKQDPSESAKQDEESNAEKTENQDKNEPEKPEIESGSN